MEFIFLQTGTTASLIPILTLIKNRAAHLVGCVLWGVDEEGKVPYWFIDATLAENPAQELLSHAINGEVLMPLHVFLVVKEPEAIGRFTVLAAVNCCNLNFSGTGDAGGQKLLELLAKHNIRTYPSELEMEMDPEPGTKYVSDESLKKASKKLFLDSFAIVAPKWLPQCWGLEPVGY